MPVIAFVVDNSASMNQRTHLGTTYMDIAKSAIENFLKIRARDQLSLRDRYMLFTLDEPPNNIRVGWKESMSTFNAELKSLQATGLTNMGPAIKQAFDVLNINRLSTGMDTYGQGRFPFYLEPSIIIVITDGHRLTSSSGTSNELILPMNTGPLGSELTEEPFRWDQRLFSIVLNMCGMHASNSNSGLENQFIPPAANLPVTAMCEVTGGRSYLVSTMKVLMQCLESLAQKLLSGVVVHFEKIISGTSEDDKLPASCYSLRKMIIVSKSPTKGYLIGHWPIPEEFWPGINLQSLPHVAIKPPRSAHPHIRFQCTPSEPLISNEIPFDKYELEPSPLTQYILERRQPNVAWQVFISGSSNDNSELGCPFGYLKASSSLQSVNLFILPYNYPELIPLMDELFTVHNLKPSKTWLLNFEQYIRTVPPYYISSLRRIFTKKGLQNLLPENMECCLPYNIQSYLKKVKAEAKLEFERVAGVNSSTITTNLIPLFARVQVNCLQEFEFDLKGNKCSKAKCFNERRHGNIVRLQCHKKRLYRLRKDLANHSSALENVKDGAMFKQQLVDLNFFSIKAKQNQKPCVNTYMQSKDNLMNLYVSLKRGASNPTYALDEQFKHDVPIQEMGNYHEYLKFKTQPLRELESQPVRQHMFGNPFKISKPIDEIDELVSNGDGTSNSKLSKRTLNECAPTINKKKRWNEILKNMVFHREVFLESFQAHSPPVDIRNDNVLFSCKDVDMRDFTNGTCFYDDSVHHQNSLELTNSDTEDFRLHVDQEATSYASLKSTCSKEVRRPGKNHSRLFKLINEDVSKKLSSNKMELFLRELLYEAARFKRHELCTRLQQVLSNIQKASISVS